MLLIATPARADVFRPAYLQLKQLDAETYDVAWKVPALDSQTTLKVEAGVSRRDRGGRLPQQRLRVGRRRAALAGAGAGRAGRQARRIHRAGPHRASTSSCAWSAPTARSRWGASLRCSRRFTLKPSPGPLEVIGTYTGLGVEHILTGADHLLFVLAL